MKHLKTVRAMIPDEVKQQICTASWTIKRSISGTVYTYIGETNCCPFYFLIPDNRLPLPSRIINKLGILESTPECEEVLTFVRAWDEGEIEPSQLPEIFGWSPS